MRLGWAPPPELFIEEIWMATATFEDTGKATTTLATLKSYEMDTTTSAIDIEHRYECLLPPSQRYGRVSLV